MNYYEIFHQYPPDCPESSLQFVASVPAETPEEALERAKQLGIKHPVVGQKEKERT